MLSDVSLRRVPWSQEVALGTIRAHAEQRGPLLPVLHALQETFGYVDPRAVPLVAKVLNVSRADVHGVLTFYPDLRSTLPGKVRVQVCRGEACQSVGGHALAQHAVSSLGVDFGGTIDASGQALAIAANGSLLGMHVDELLRGTVGDNIFGKSSSRRITVDGKVDARSVKLTAKGVSAAELRESITGATTVSGIMRAAMAPGAQSFAQFATGIGSIFSNTSAFDWAVLGAFINRENTVTGGVALGGGTVNLKDLTLQGGNTTAVINGSNRMADGTTNTTIRLNTANRGYVATMTGKLASPDLHAVSQ